MRSYLQMRTWAWYRLWQKVKPLLNVTRVEDEIKALEDKAALAQANFEKEEKLRKELEANLAKLTTEKNDLLNRLQAESGTVADFHDKQNKLMSQKADLEAQLSVSFNIQSQTNVESPQYRVDNSRIGPLDFTRHVCDGRRDTV